MGCSLSPWKDGCRAIRVSAVFSNDCCSEGAKDDFGAPSRLSVKEDFFGADGKQPVPALRSAAVDIVISKELAFIMLVEVACVLA